MMNTLYTVATLSTLSRAELWEICTSLQLPHRRSKQSCIQEILETQPQLVEPAQVEKIESTCQTCPNFESFEESSGRGLCKLFDKVVRFWHSKTQDCCNEEAMVATETTEPTLADYDRGFLVGLKDGKAASPRNKYGRKEWKRGYEDGYNDGVELQVKPATRLEYYRAPRPNQIICLSYKPEYLNPGRYTITQFSGITQCDCPARVECKHLKQMPKTVTKREPISLEADNESFLICLGEKVVGKVKQALKSTANSIADAWFEEEIKHYQTYELIAPNRGSGRLFA